MSIWMRCPNALASVIYAFYVERSFADAQDDSAAKGLIRRVLSGRFGITCKSMCLCIYFSKPEQEVFKTQREIPVVFAFFQTVRHQKGEKVAGRCPKQVFNGRN